MAEKTTKNITGTHHLDRDGVVRLMRDMTATGNLVSIGARYSLSDGRRFSRLCHHPSPCYE